MRAVVQRVKEAFVSVENNVTGQIENGLLVYLGVAKGDSEKDADILAEKIANLRIFSDSQDKMNLSILDLIEAEAGKKNTGVLAISQFTLLGDCKKGRRPYYGEAADPEPAKKLYEYFMRKIRGHGLLCESGVFQAHMEVHSINDGPVTILLDSALLKN